MRVWLSFGSWPSAAVPHFSDSAGIAMISSVAVASDADSTGRRMTVFVQRVQKGARFGSAARFGRTLRHWRSTHVMIVPRSETRLPSSTMSTGSSVIAASTAIATTMIAPMAIDRIVLESMRNRPASEIRTVMPEIVTARPEVRIAASRARAGSRPLCSSSR
jgi:hypothetical protein